MGAQERTSSGRTDGARRVAAWVLLLLLAGSLLPPSRAAVTRVVINEFMVDPAAGGHEWVELYNAEAVAVNVDGWVLSDEDGNDYVLPNVPDMPPGERIVIHFANGTDETSFGQSEPGVLHLYAPFQDVLEASDQLSLYNALPKGPSTIMDYVDWLSGGVVQACSTPALVSGANDTAPDVGVALAGFAGQLQAVWTSQDPAIKTGQDADVVARAYSAGSWGAFDEVNTPGDADWQDDDAALASHAGLLYAFWTDGQKPTGAPSFLNYSTHDGTSWGGETSLEVGPVNGTNDDPTAASYGGDLYVAWQRTEWGPNYANDIVYRRFNGSAWSSLQYVSDAGDGIYDSDPGAIAHNGLLYVFWLRSNWSSPDPTGIAYKTFDGATWSGLQLAVNGSANGGMTQDRDTYSVEVFGGALHLAWTAYESDPTNGSIGSIFHRALQGGAWGAIERLSTPAGVNSGDFDPDLEATADALYAVWAHFAYSPNPGNQTTYIQDLRMRAFQGASWTAELNLTNDSAGDYAPDLESIGLAVYVAWVAYDGASGSDADVRFCRLQSAGSLGDDENAVQAGIWSPGTYVDTTAMVQNLTVYRTVDGNDTDTPGDWSFADYLPPVPLAGPDQTVPEDSLVMFNASASYDNLGIVAYYWDADNADGFDWALPDMVGDIVDWVYADPGAYTATLRAEDAAGNWATDEVVVTVADIPNEPPAVTDFNVSASWVYRRDSVDLFVNGTDPEEPEDALNAQFQWRARSSIAWRTTYFGGATYIGLPPLGFFTAAFTPGPSAPVDLYSLRARLRDTNASYSGWFTLTDALDVRSDLPVADAGPDQSVNEDANLTLDGSNSWDDKGIVEYAWFFGDGSSTAGPNPVVVHQWVQPGTYTVRLVVTDTHGNTDDDTATVTVYDITPPQAHITGPASIEEDHGAAFSGATSTDNVGVVWFAWDFGDGASQNGSSPIAIHAYDDPGTYTVGLTVRDAAGNEGNTTASILVTDLITVNDDGGEDFTTIQAAVDFAPAGAKIFVHSGVYNEDVSLYKAVLLEGAGRDVTFVDGTGTTFNVTADAVDITGFTLRTATICLYADQVDGLHLTHSRILQCDTGLYAYYTTNSFIAWNVFTEGKYGIIADHVFDDAYRWNEISYFTGYGAKSYDSQLENCFNWNQFHHNRVAYYYDPTRDLLPLLFDGNELWANEVGLKVSDASSILITDNTFGDNGIAIQLVNASPEISGNRFVGGGVALDCDRSAAYVHDNDLTALTDPAVRCSRADGLRFEDNALAGGAFAFTDSAVASLDLPAGSALFVGSTVTAIELGPQAVATYAWRLTVLVEDRLKAAVPGAEVRVADADGTVVASAVTGADGRTPPLTVTTLMQTRGGTAARGPFSVTATKDTFAGSATIDLAADTEIAVSLPGYPPAAPGGTEAPPFPAFAVLAIAALLFSAGLLSGGLGTSEVGRYHLWLFVLPLFTRLKKEEILDQPTRYKILGFVLGNPGAHFALIGQRLGLAHGQLAYHLDVLTKEGHVFARSDGFKKRFYPADTPLEVAQGFVMSDVQEKIAEVIAANPGIGKHGLTAALGLSRQVVTYHLEKLEKATQVRRVGEGRTAQYYLVDEGKGWVSSAPTNGGV